MGHMGHGSQNMTIVTVSSDGQDKTDPHLLSYERVHTTL